MYSRVNVLSFLKHNATHPTFTNFEISFEMPPNIRIKAPSNSNKNNRLHIGFDDDARSDFLRGFSKRKAERRSVFLATSFGNE